MPGGGGPGKEVEKGEAVWLSVVKNGRRDCTGVGRRGREVEGRSLHGDIGARLKAGKARRGLEVKPSGDQSVSLTESGS